MKETADSFPPLHTGSFLTKEQAEQFRETFKNLTVVVRCKDCKWFEMPRYGERGFCKNVALIRQTTFYCADGERKSADEKLMEEMDADPLG